MKLKTLLSGVLAVALMLTSGLTMVSASNYTPIQGTETTLTKYLVVDENAEIPNVTFTFNVSAGNAVEATATTVKTWAGLNPELVEVNGVAQSGTTVFTPDDATTAGTATDGIANSTTKKYASKVINLDFSGVTFTEPGVYRYRLTEQASSVSAVTIDSVPVRTIDVYVVDNAGTLQVAAYVCYEGEITDAAKVLPSNIAAVDMTEWDAANPAPTVVEEPTPPVDLENPTPEEQAAVAAYEAYLQAKETYDNARAAEVQRQTEANLAAAAAADPNGAEAGETKSEKYVNEYTTKDLTITKTVTGNQGSRDQYFKFTVTIRNAGTGTVMTLDTSGAETTTHANTATSHAVATMNEANQKDDDNEDTEPVLYTQDEFDAYVAANGENPAWAVGDVKTPGRTAKAGQQIIAEDGSVTFDFYMHHGQSIVLKGIPKNATWEIVEENAAGYTTTKTNDTGTIIDEDITSDWTNHREGTIPTGLIATIGAGVGLVAIAGAGIVLASKKKKED